jgi:methylenetetrahydrofolate dehydrogenase (NADP+)/methenyltetrahydrofolate cyclohydrolase
MTDTAGPRLLGGSALAHEILDAAAAAAQTFPTRVGRAPCLATVLVGDDPASVSYVKMKRTGRQRHGIESRLVALSADLGTAEDDSGSVRAGADEPLLLKLLHLSIAQSE